MLDVDGNARIRSIGSGAYSFPVNASADGTLTSSTSDRRFKKDIRGIDNSLDLVKELRGVKFSWRDESVSGTHMGLIAQEVEKVIPELVYTNPVDGYMGINYDEVTAVLIEAIKEQQKIIESKEMRIRSLEDRLLGIEEKISSISK
jgi:hypothetical protein